MSISRPVTVLTLATALLLGGCASRGPVPTFYDFGPAGAQTVQQTAPPLPVLVIADANGPSWLDSQRMYYRLLYADAQQSRPYAYNRWNTPPLQLLSQRLKTRIAQGGVKVLSTTDAASGIPLLRIDVDDFSQNFDTQTQSSGHVSLRASLFRGHRLIDQKTFSRSSDARSADAQGGAQALASASDAIAADLLTWLGTLNIPKE
ncbi:MULTISPECIES: ABC-type transport auxiliary lipoprotein family protein [unclassified Janthinobacterium]|uniref:ABC-type transport auxiliary lipoprotein family protein n=1 Tax=unclassified Janthinobacterium TaxID=2610881 RepID=UPI001613B1C2|nr:MULTISPECIES: ABC-type transport auxiliary lipoprotein family protein [unclassified Janthinobacterium]MBB5371616.1 cholesterol transport system auxiliary component [Janthinobacterium sp. K2C7]MBB5384421.1 cholesterol transport system auxiliary component [Janthinobacterium sp. K2Li3]MBB5389697.1 cholesterol transport system auxiliary component [Janthinobacterium sp. K2E3]